MAQKKGTRKGSKKAKALDETKASGRKETKKNKKLYSQTVFYDWCKACGICSAFCPKKVIGCDDSGAPVIVRPDSCIGCRFCESHCPDFAITIMEQNAAGEELTHES